MTSSTSPTPRDRWGRRCFIASLALAVVGAVALLVAPLGSQAGVWTFRAGFTLLRWAVYTAVGASVLALLAGALARRWRLAIAALGLAFVVMAVPLWWLHTARSVPPIHDITTDTADPPAFEAIVALRAAAPNPSTYDPAVAALQREAYPDLAPLDVARPPAEVFGHVRGAAEAMGWEIVAADAGRGRLEATDTTFWFRFKDDVVVRVVAMADGARVDVRSKSRVGRSDVGTNASRIRAYLAEVRRRVGGG